MHGINRSLALVAIVVATTACGSVWDRGVVGGPDPAPVLPPAADRSIPGPDGTTYRFVEVDDDLTVPGNPVTAGVVVSTTDSTVVVGFWMGPDTCTAVVAVDVEETDTNVDLHIALATRPGAGACPDIAEARAVEVVLAAPLGDRHLTLDGVPAER